MLCFHFEPFPNMACRVSKLYYLANRKSYQHLAPRLYKTYHVDFHATSNMACLLALTYHTIKLYKLSCVLALSKSDMLCFHFEPVPNMACRVSKQCYLANRKSYQHLAPRLYKTYHVDFHATSNMACLLVLTYHTIKLYKLSCVLALSKSDMLCFHFEPFPNMACRVSKQCYLANRKSYRYLAPRLYKTYHVDSHATSNMASFFPEPETQPLNIRLTAHGKVLGKGYRLAAESAQEYRHIYPY